MQFFVSAGDTCAGRKHQMIFKFDFAIKIRYTDMSIFVCCSGGAFWILPKYLLADAVPRYQYQVPQGVQKY
jgi:hypothetical protein